MNSNPRMASNPTFRSPDHTLTDEEVARHRRKIIARLERDLDAEVRA